MRHDIVRIFSPHIFFVIRSSESVNAVAARMWGSRRKCAKIVSEAVGFASIRLASTQEILNGNVGTLPDRDGACKQSASLGRQCHHTGAAVGRVCGNFEQPAAL
jgi:hypothetical protein